MQFLSTKIPPRKDRVQPTTQVPLTNPADEWIYLFREFCSDDLDKASFRKAVRNRKEILRRRRRTRVRAAAAAASGRATRMQVGRHSHDARGGCCAA